jgi:hypothetical protein
MVRYIKVNTFTLDEQRRIMAYLDNVQVWLVLGRLPKRLM